MKAVLVAVADATTVGSAAADPVGKGRAALDHERGVISGPRMAVACSWRYDWLARWLCAEAVQGSHSRAVQAAARGGQRSFSMDRAATLALLVKNRSEIERRFGVTSLSLFGSLARDEASPDSDVDVLVEFRDTPGLSQYMGLKFWLEELLGRPVDVVLAGALKEWARPAVEAEAIRIA